MNQKCILRGHLNLISAIETFNENLITGDDHGWIIWWDIVTRNPLGCWKGHDMTILTIKQLDECHILTHSKDSEIRIWDLATAQLSKTLPDVVYNDIKYNDDTKSLHHKYPMPAFNSIPINSLNYCNVDYLQGLLITPATVDSNNFDIYRVNHQQFSIDRLIKNFDPYQLYISSNSIIPEISNDKRQGFGIMMKILFINSDLFYIGYESGHLLGFKILYSKPIDSLNLQPLSHSRTIINVLPKISIAYYNDFHVPNPILSIAKLDQRLLVGSTHRKMSIHPIDSKSEMEVVDIKNKGIQSIAIDTSIYVGLWNGVIKIYDYNFNKIDKFQRSLPVLQNIHTNSSNDDSLQELNVKLSVIKIIKSKPKLITSKRDLVLNKQLHNKTCLIAGYNDGKLFIFETV